MRNLLSKEGTTTNQIKRYEVNNKRDRLRRAGLVFGIIAIVIIIVFFTPVVLLGEPSGLELFIFLVLPLIYVIASIIVARKYELIGGIMLLIPGLFSISIIFIYSPDWSWWFIIYWVVFFTLPLLLADSLYLFSWQIMRSNIEK